jgi:DNA-binding SARP family transcriptional activator
MEFRILGPLEVVEGRDRISLGPEKQRAVLAMLLLDANHTVPVDRLIDGLWGDGTPGNAVKAIHTYVSRLRKVVPGERLRTRPPGYAIEVEPEELDLQRFERLLAEAQRASAGGDARAASATLQQALALWRGPALAEFVSEPFAAAEGGRLEERHLLALEERIDADLALGRHADVVGELERLVAAHRFRERLLGQLMLALYRSGRQAEALTAYRGGRNVLVDQLGIEPSRALHDLEGAILRQDASLDLAPEPPATARRRPASREPQPFVGREQELQRLGDALDDALAGQGWLVLVSGEQGIGKTRVATELALRAERRGAQVLWGRCYEREGAPPYWPWVQVIRGYVRDRPDLAGAGLTRYGSVVAELVPELRERLPDVAPPPGLREPKDERFRLLDAIALFLVQASRAGPLAIVLDDLHASDADSLLLLEFVARQLVDAHVLVLGTYRDVELTRGHRLVETLAELTREDRVERLVLGGLSEQEVAQLVDASIEAPSSTGLARDVHEQTDGNPLFVTEVVRLLADESDRSGPGRSAHHGEAVRVPEGVRVVIGRRLDRLSAECYEVLRLGALVGREFGQGQLVALTDADHLDDLLQEALDAHVLEEVSEAPGRLRFTHRLVQETLTTELSTTKRVRAHARIGQALEEYYGNAADEHAAELVRHFAEAETVLGAAGLIRYSRAAGAQALVAHAYDEAREHFQRALDAKHGQLMDDETALLLFGLARSELAVRERYDLEVPLGHLRSAFSHFAESDDERTAVEIASYPIPYVYGSPDVADLATRALPMVPASSVEAGYLLSTLGWFTGMRDRAGAGDAFERSAAIAKRLDDTALQRRVLTSEAHVDFWHLAYRDCMAKAREAVELARSAGDERTEMVALSELARMSATMGRPSESEEHCDRMLTLAERFRERYWLVTARVNRLWLAVLRGEWDVARTLGDEALGLQPRDARSLAVMALMAAQLGDRPEAEAYAERLHQARSLSARGFAFEDACAAGYLPRIARITGADTWLGVAEDAARRVLSSEVVLPFLDLYVRTGRAFAACGRNDSGAARSAHDALESQGGVAPAFLCLATDRLLGLLAMTAGDAQTAVTHLESGLAFCRRAGYLAELAWTASDLAETLRARGGPGDETRADELRDEAGGVAAELSMNALSDRLAPPG